jgi:hypothetical protein
MENVLNYFQEFHVQFGPGVFVIFILMTFIAVVGQWKLYEKCNLPGYAALIPGWNVIVFLKIMGRPAHHALLLLVPGYNIYFLFKLYVELCQSFGRNKSIDYAMVFIFNGLYVLNLGLSYDAVYRGPVYHPSTPSNVQFA